MSAIYKAQRLEYYFGPPNAPLTKSMACVALHNAQKHLLDKYPKALAPPVDYSGKLWDIRCACRILAALNELVSLTH